MIDTDHHIVTWPEVHRDARYLVRKLIKRTPWKGIVALTRGGLVPAAILARELDIRIIDTLCISAYDNADGLAEGDLGDVSVLKVPEQATQDKGTDWLLVDDLVDTGATMRAAREILPNAHVATVYAKPDGAGLVDTFVHEIAQDVWIYFPWDTEPRYAEPLSKITPTTAT